MVAVLSRILILYANGTLNGTQALLRLFITPFLSTSQNGWCEKVCGVVIQWLHFH